MKLMIDQEIDAEVIHHYDENLMITSKCNVITIKYEQEVKNINLPLSSLKKVLSFFRLARRALRTDKSVFVPIYFDCKFQKYCWQNLISGKPF